jgi:hypothetical protein
MYGRDGEIRWSGRVSGAQWRVAGGVAHSASAVERSPSRQ